MTDIKFYDGNNQHLTFFPSYNRKIQNRIRGNKMDICACMIRELFVLFAGTRIVNSNMTSGRCRDVIFEKKIPNTPELRHYTPVFRYICAFVMSKHHRICIFGLHIR